MTTPANSTHTMPECYDENEEWGKIEESGEWIYMIADMELIEETILAAQAQDMTLSEYLKMCHEEYTGTVSN